MALGTQAILERRAADGTQLLLLDFERRVLCHLLADGLRQLLGGQLEDLQRRDQLGADVDADMGEEALVLLEVHRLAPVRPSLRHKGPLDHRPFHAHSWALGALLKQLPCQAALFATSVPSNAGTAASRAAGR